MKKTHLAISALLAGTMTAAVHAGGGVSRREYLDIAETCLRAYSEDRIAEYVRDAERKGFCEHGFPRLAANLGVLVADGRQPERKELLAHMLDLCCGQFWRRKAANDFSVREIVHALGELEKAKAFPDGTLARWRADLARIVPERTYTCLVTNEQRKAQNWAVFAAASEQTRIGAGLGGDRAFVERQLACELPFFDRNGMFRDPGNPVVYDLVTRLQCAVALSAGYDGASRARLEEVMDRSAGPTLSMLSATGQIPYGGRSNQMLHNEMFHAALCEWYARRFRDCGDMETAGRYRAAARRAVESFRSWANGSPRTHVKNTYPVETKFGCEGYAYFNKYMVTAGSWACLGAQFADETIPCVEPDEGASVWTSGESFGLVLLNAAGQTVQLNLRPDAHYDAAGIGRYERRGMPPTICLSVPCAKNPRYEINGTNPCCLAIAPHGISAVRLVSKSATNGVATAEFSVLSDGRPARWRIALSADGLDMRLAGKGPLAMDLPALVTDGGRVSKMTQRGNKLEIAFCGAACIYETDGELSATADLCRNRNGVYRRYAATRVGELNVRAKIVPAAAAADAVETVRWQREIDAAAARGGGRVVVPAGRHLVGELELRNNVELHLEKGAVLEGVPGIENYRARILPFSEGTWSAVVSGLCVTNVAITGEGEIFGNGRVWNPPNGAVDAVGCREGLRPRGIFFGDSRNVRLEGFRLRDAACWGIVLKRCEDVTARGVRIDSCANLNNDGFDIEARNVLVQDCDIDCGDDAICLKSNDPDFIVENVTVRDCVARTHCNAVKFGTASHGTMRNVRFERIRIEAPRRVYRDLAPMPEDLLNPPPVKGAPRYLTGPGIGAICIECVDGGIVEDVTVDGVELSGHKVPLFIRGGRRQRRACGIPPNDKCVLRNILVENVRGRAESRIPSSVTGVPGCRPENVTLRNVAIECVGDGDAPIRVPGRELDGVYPEATMFGPPYRLPVYGLYADEPDAVKLENVVFSLREGTADSRPAFDCAAGALCVTDAVTSVAAAEPWDAGAPRIMAPSAWGAEQGLAFRYTFPVCGARNGMAYSLSGRMPDGVTFDAATATLGGRAAAGEYPLVFTAKNALGESRRAFLLKIGRDCRAQTPPMGWSSWNAWGARISQRRMLAAARAMVAHGLAARGWTFVNADAGWAEELAKPGDKRRPEALRANAKFPDMPGMVAEIHSLGLKAGIYSSPMVYTWWGFDARHVPPVYPGSRGHPVDPRYALSFRPFEKSGASGIGSVGYEKVDAAAWAAWGFDFLKYDWTDTYADLCAVMREALDATGRDFTLQLCVGCFRKDAAAYRACAELARGGGDTDDRWRQMTSVARRGDAWRDVTGPGLWYDADMLAVGRLQINRDWRGIADPPEDGPLPADARFDNRLTREEQIFHFAYWVCAQYPLFLSCDLVGLDPLVRDLACNEELIALNQDTSPDRMSFQDLDGGLRIGTRRLADGRVCHAVFNFADGTRKATIGLDGVRKVRDVLARKSLGRAKALELTVPAHAARVYTCGH